MVSITIFRYPPYNALFIAFIDTFLGVYYFQENKIVPKLFFLVIY